MIGVKITQMGVWVSDRFFAYTSLKAFWIIYKPPFVTRLYLRLANKSGTEVKIELNHQSPVEVRQLLAREIPEIEGGDESMADVFIRLLRLQ